MKITITLQVIACFLLLSGCANIEVAHYRHEKPELDLPRFFSAPVQAWGMFQKRSGEVVKRFVVTIDGRMEGHQLVLDERFVYSDGTRQRRVWTLTPDGPGRWRGTAGDVVGQAHGELAGNTLRWRYTLNLEVEGEVYPVQFDDWMYLIDEDTLINRSFMSTLGVELGQVTLFFRRGTLQP